MVNGGQPRRRLGHRRLRRPAPVPAPETTIACRRSHIAVDALDRSSSRAFDRSGTGLTGTAWVLDVERGLSLLERSWQEFYAGLTDLAAGMVVPILGPA